MQGSTLVRIYKTLSTEERRQFSDFVQAILPQMSKNKPRILKLITLLEQAAPDFDLVKVSKERAVQYVFAGKQTPAGALEKLMVDLNRLLKSFLLWNYHQRQQHYYRQQTDWLEILEQRGLGDIRDSTLNKLQKEIQIANSKTPADLHDILLVEMAIFSRQTKMNQLRGDLNVPGALQALDAFYYFTRLELLNHFLLQQKVTNLDTPEPVAYALNTPGEPPVYALNFPGLLISFKIFQLLQQDIPPKEEIIDLMDLLRKHELALPSEMLKQYYTYLRNFCTILINAGNSDLLETYHQLQKDNLERGYLYYNGNYISASAYISVAIGAIRARNLDWCLRFIEDHRGRVLGENEQFDLYRLNKAQYYFATGSYEKALDSLPHSLEVLNYALLAKRLEIKVLFELQSDLLPYKTGAFKTYTSRASGKYMPPALRNINREFVNLVIQLMHTPPYDKSRATRLIQRIDSKPQVADREWLIEKALFLKR